MSSAEIVATCAISSSVDIGLAIFLSSFTTSVQAISIPLLIAKGHEPAVTFLNPSLISDWANSVAVVVPSPATSFAFSATCLTMLAPTFSALSSKSITFAIETPSLVIVGEPKLSSKTTFLPFGPNVTVTTFASLSTPAFNFAFASSE